MEIRIEPKRRKPKPARANIGDPVLFADCFGKIVSSDPMPIAEFVFFNKKKIRYPFTRAEEIQKAFDDFKAAAAEIQKRRGEEYRKLIFTNLHQIGGELP